MQIHALKGRWEAKGVAKKTIDPKKQKGPAGNQT
jgi:hypothetical protein